MRLPRGSAVLAATMPPPVDNTPKDPGAAAGVGERIAKLLARAGVASRREIERMIADGRIARHGVAIDTPATVLASLDGVTVDGAPVAQAAPARLFLYHKPTGLLVTERDPRGRPTIYDRLPADLPRVIPVGRLDLNTEGLLLLTTDGGFKRELELPANGVERTYRARAYGSVTQAQLEDLMDGVEIEGVRYGPINANLERRTGANTWIEMTLTEGKNREVRRVLEHLGLQVGRLIRVRYGPFILADLPPGDIGEVRQADLLAFRHSLSARRKDDTRIAIPTRDTAPRGQSVRRPARGAGSGATAAMSGRPASQAVRTPRPTSHPGADRGPVKRPSERQRGPGPSDPRSSPSPRDARTAPNPALTGKPFKWRGAPPPASAASLDPGLHRVGPAAKTKLDRPGRSPDRASASTATPTVDAAAPRAAKPQRKAGWAKPRPKAGPPRRPGKPR